MLTASELWFRYDRTLPWVVQGFDLAVEDGQVLGLAGPSGAGKSTVGRLLAGHRTPDRGQVLLDGEPLVAQRGTPFPVQLVGQHPLAAMNPRWRVRDVLAETGASEDAIQGYQPSLVEPTWLDRFPHEISGGQLQRVNLARALLARPRFVVADEITASLDPVTQAQVWLLLLDHARRLGIGVLAISHDAALLDVVADRTVQWEMTGQPEGEAVEPDVELRSELDVVASGR